MEGCMEAFHYNSIVAQLDRWCKEMRCDMMEPGSYGSAAAPALRGTYRCHFCVLFRKWPMQQEAIAHSQGNGYFILRLPAKKGHKVLGVGLLGIFSVPGRC